MKSVRRSSFVFAASGLLLLLTSCAKTPPPQQAEKKEPAKPAPSVPQVKVSPAIQAKAELGKPGPKATKKATADAFGNGRAAITVKGHPGGVHHSFWAEELDVDGSGQPVTVDEAWDNQHKVLYISKDRQFTCGDGQTADGSTLMAVYGKGNTLHKPAGSGWWVAELDQGECSVESAGIYGCRFEPDGTNHDCGTATMQSEQDDVVIVPLPGAASGAPEGAPATPPSQPSAPSAQPSAPPSGTP